MQDLESADIQIMGQEIHAIFFHSTLQKETFHLSLVTRGAFPALSLKSMKLSYSFPLQEMSYRGKMSYSPENVRCVSNICSFSDK